MSTNSPPALNNGGKNGNIKIGFTVIVVVGVIAAATIIASVLIIMGSPEEAVMLLAVLYPLVLALVGVLVTLASKFQQVHELVNSQTHEMIAVAIELATLREEMKSAKKIAELVATAAEKGVGEEKAAELAIVTAEILASAEAAPALLPAKAYVEPVDVVEKKEKEEA
jgi:hypothetical protein